MQQGSKEWLEWRRNGIGASDAPTIMGENPYKNSVELWEEKVGLKESFKGNSRTQRGHDLEPLARAEFEKLTGYVVVPQLATHPVHDFIRASLDGLSFDGKHLVEIKCPGTKDHQIALDGEVPKHYMAQLQHQMYVVGLNKMHYLSFDGSKAVVLEVYQNQFYVESLVDQETKFWNQVKTFTPPEHKYTTRDDDLWNEAAEKWKQANQKLKELEVLAESARKSLIDLSGNTNTQGAGVRLSRCIRPGNVNYKEIPILQGVDLDAYRNKPVESWRIACG